MVRQVSAPLLALSVTSDAGPALHQQLYQQLREAVLSGNLAPGRRLPSSRALAQDLGCARNTVLNAYEQLISEGYLETRHGAGSFVSSVLPEELLSTPGAGSRPMVTTAATGPVLSKRGQDLAGLVRPGRTRHRAFTPGLPDLEAFPFRQWSRLLGSVWRHPKADLLKHGDSAGYGPLRQAIASYLNGVRALGCRAEQILITNGSQQATDLVARLLLDPGDQVWLEDPGYPGLRGPLRAASAKMVPVPVDTEGFQVAEALRTAPGARLAVIAPSHQYPLGHRMSLPRRLALLDWAYEREGWILEDDYDSEYRYSGRPLAALRGLDAQRSDGGGRVIYLGSFSKVLFPSLRLAYLVVPEALMANFVSARAALDDHPTMITQPVVARFMEGGHFAAHIRRMRLLYQGRQQTLLKAAAEHLSSHLTLRPDEAGMHLVARLSPDLERRLGDREVSRRAAQAGISVAPLSAYYLNDQSRQGLLLGYAAVPEGEIYQTVRRLADLLDAA